MLVKVTCDAKGCYFEENYAVCDDETTNELKKRLEANGWVIIGEDHFCPNCTSGL